MKILLVAERYYPEVGAAPSRLTNMAEGLQQQGAEVDVLTSLPNYPKGRIYDGYRHRISMHDMVNGCHVYRYWAYATVSRSALKRALNMISFAVTIWLFVFRVKRIKQYDRVIIQTPTLFVATSAMWLFKGLYKRKCILNVSDIWPSTAVDMGAMVEGSKAHKVMSWCERYLYRKADAVLGQSQEILNRVAELPSTNKVFLYRNLQKYRVDKDYRDRGTTLKVCFAGMLGVAQDIFSIAKNIDFKKLGVEFHIVGEGNQYNMIKDYISKNPDSNVIAHGMVPKDKMAGMYEQFDVAIVPLMTRIHGAFPSKVFDILPMGIPILFCGGGEGADFVASHNVGYVSAPGDYTALQANIEKVRDLSSDEYRQLSTNCITTTRQELDFTKQMTECYQFIHSI